MTEDDERRTHSLTKSDLAGLMESYKNTIESNLILNEKQDMILARITEVCKVFIEVKQVIEEQNKEITEHHSSCKDQQRVYNSELLKDISEKHTDGVRSTSSINIKIYGIIGVLLTIIIGLIGFAFKIVEKIPHHVPLP